jgi:hypothetical protein
LLRRLRQIAELIYLVQQFNTPSVGEHLFTHPNRQFSMQIESVFAHDPPIAIDEAMIAGLTPKIKPGKFWFQNIPDFTLIIIF